jgi:hypothetical protein
MSISEHDLDVLADEILQKMDQGEFAPTLSNVVNYIEALGFSATDKEAIGRLVLAKSQNKNLKPKHIIILIHGIRTHAPWHGTAVEVLSPHCTKVVPLKYGYHDLARFWFPWFTRARPIKLIEEEIRAIISDNPNAHISVVAHSFGTYIITKILRRSTDIKLFRLLLCGSVVPLKFPWRLLPNRPRGGMMNDVGTQDRLPILAEISTWGYGASGTFGFGTNFIDENFHDFGHSGFFTKPHISAYWVPFLFYGNYVVSSENSGKVEPGYGWDIARLFHLKYILIAGGVFALSRFLRS